MSFKTVVNGQPSSVISVRDRAIQFGDGLFETIAIKAGNPLCWEQHMSRLNEGCRRLKITFLDFKLLEKEALSLLGEVNDKAILKIIITRGETMQGYQFSEQCKPNRILSLLPWPDYPLDYKDKGVATTICKNRYSLQPSLAGIKHLNRLEQILARSEILNKEITEGIVTDMTDNVIEGTMSNIFIRLGSVLVTPDLSQCGITGVIRQLIIEAQQDLRIDIAIDSVSLSQLKQAEEIFLCNSIIGIWPVRQIDDIIYNCFDISKRIRQLFVSREQVLV